MEKDELDQIIDSALRDLGAVEPRPGLEARVLNCVRVEISRPRLIMWRWALAGSGALTAIVGLWMWQEARLIPVAQPPSVMVAQHQAFPPVAKTKLAEFAIAKRRGVRRRVSPPRLSPEEEALVELVSTHPQEALTAFADLQRKQSAQVEIAELQIQPIQIKELFEENN